MDKPPSPDYSNSDEALAAFTDRLLSASPDIPPPPNSLDPEMAALEQTILRLRDSFGPPEHPPLDTVARIHQNLTMSWQRTQHAKIQVQPEQASWLERVKDLFGWDSTRRRQRTMTLAFATVAVLTLILTIWLSPPAGSSPATATSRIPGLVIFAFFLVVTALAFFWDRLKK